MKRPNNSAKKIICDRDLVSLTFHMILFCKDNIFFRISCYLCNKSSFLKAETDGGVDEPVVQVSVAGAVMVADVVELSVGTEVNALEVVGQ